MYCPAKTYFFAEFLDMVARHVPEESMVIGEDFPHAYFVQEKLLFWDIPSGKLT